MYDILGNRRVTEEILRTTLCLVEQSLNARPITAVITNPLDLEALTPNHFILGQHAASFPSLSFEENFGHKKRFARAQSYANAIWTRWMREYVPSLNRRAKWHNQSDVKLKAGDLVWVIEPDTPCGHYRTYPKTALWQEQMREIRRHKDRYERTDPPDRKARSRSSLFRGGGCCSANVNVSESINAYKCKSI